MNTLQTFTTGSGKSGQYYSLPALAEQGFPGIRRMPVSLRIVLESLLRNCDGLKVTEQDVKNLAGWNAGTPGNYEIPFTVARIILQDLTGVPLLVDLAAMRAAVQDLGKNPADMEPLVPVDLVVDHSVQVDWAGFPAAYQKNLTREFERNTERYEFLKWGQQAFKTFSVVPPSTGIVHQVNLEHLARGVMENGGVYYPDSLVGTDSHTTMINGLGIVAWGVGGIEAEAGMLGQPVTFLVPEVVGVHLSGKLREGVTATDLALHVTQMLRAHGVVGKFVEFFGEGAASLSLPDRATVANMAPEYGATMGFFPFDEVSAAYLRATGRSDEQVTTCENYFRAQGLFGMPRKGQLDYTVELELDLSTIVPAVAGPKRPQDRIPLSTLKEQFAEICRSTYGQEQRSTPVAVTMQGDAGNPDAPTTHDVELTDGAILVAAITSCTNTSNDGLMLAAGLLAKKAAALGMKVPAYVKTSIAPGSRIAARYFDNNDLTAALDSIGFSIVGYGCTTCIGNSGPLNSALEEAVVNHNLVSCSVLSGNRNFEARIHSHVKANFLMSPPLVIAFALAGRVDIDMETDPLGTAADGSPVYLRDIWPTSEEIAAAQAKAASPADYAACYAGHVPEWDSVSAPTGATFAWNADSTYIHRPPFFDGFDGRKGDITDIVNARPLGIFGDSVTTDHISPAGAIKPTAPAGQFLSAQGVERRDFNTYGSRRGNDLVMARGTFANVRIKNLLTAGVEGGYTLYFGSSPVSAPDTEIAAPCGTPTFIYDAGMAYLKDGVSTIIIGGEDYGMGSSRDWAAKGTNLLGVKAVITKSFERIHRSNLIGMGVLPLNFANPADYDRVKDLKDVRFSIIGLNNDIAPRSTATLLVQPTGGEPFELPLIVRLDTPIEKEYFRAGGILQYVLTQYC
ncbi:MAG: aconitate hydratase AcnA [Akkermansia sp.]|nr:aconitate hydratase AcnA [Akkermansia sp.]MBR2313272.1 aconitate hydratase AcnA [Akkermansia sp.]